MTNQSSIYENGDRFHLNGLSCLSILTQELRMFLPSIGGPDASSGGAVLPDRVWSLSHAVGGRGTVAGGAPW